MTTLQEGANRVRTVDPFNINEKDGAWLSDSQHH